MRLVVSRSSVFNKKLEVMRALITGTNLLSYSNYFRDQDYNLQQKMCWGFLVLLRFLYISGVESIYQCMMLLKSFCKAKLTLCQLGTLRN